MSSPLVFDVADVLRHGGGSVMRVNHGAIDQRIGAEMIAITPGTESTVTAHLIPLGEGLMVEAAIETTLTGECCRCLTTLHVPSRFDITAVYADSPDFVTHTGTDRAPEDEDDGACVGVVENGTIDLIQPLTDVAGLTLPFSPTCEMYGLECSDHESGISITPADAATGKSEESEPRDPAPDPRWAGLEKFRQ